MRKGRKTLVCGGRDFWDIARVYRTLCELQPSEIIEGGAGGADELARDWAMVFDVPCTTVRANWRLHGYRAGPIRNRKMLDEHKPEQVVAFPGGRGTANMVNIATAAGVDVIHA